jgi:hypothetical protein
MHYAKACAKFKDTAVQALHRVLERNRPEDPEAVAELEILISRLGGGA